MVKELKIIIAIALAAVVLGLAGSLVPLGSALAVNGCPPGFDLTSPLFSLSPSDMNADGFVCVKPLPPALGGFVFLVIDNNIPE